VTREDQAMGGKSDGMTIRLSGADWMRLFVGLFAHLATFLFYLHRVHTEMEHRVTVVETTQQMMVDVLKDIRKQQQFEASRKDFRGE
jgi:hypothetical protein